MTLPAFQYAPWPGWTPAPFWGGFCPCCGKALNWGYHTPWWCRDTNPSKYEPVSNAKDSNFDKGMQ